MATTDVVIAEILSGTTDSARLTTRRRPLDACTCLAQEPYADALEATRIYRTCRARGESPPQLTGCFVAAMAIRHDVPALHRDRDHTVMARHTALRALIA